MEIWVTIALFLVGLVLIMKGGDWFLNGAVWIAEATGVPRFIIGATIVSLATTLPELTVSVTGVLQGQVDLAVGNAVGSVTANLGLILGISVVCMPSVVSPKQFNMKALLMVGGAVLLFALCRGGTLAFLPGLALFAVFILYLANNVADARTGMAARREEHGRRTVSHRQMGMKLGLFAVGITAIVIGSRLLIDYGSELALLLGVPSSIIGVTMVAIGTSLPELVTTLTAIARREASMSVGNIIGANVIDLTMILPVCAAVSGGRLTIGAQTTALDLPACLLLCCVAVLPPLFKGRFYRWQGFLMLALYALYVVVLIA
ncbi:calcium/sodium antiporter [Oscillibacter sp.]|uniref:calcium/sodium antiporter n=1 Tax=Oscillibacter sp. TaxID=1945593 RepID=UPI002636ACB2|nr:calcium/sodium antiporter [Oscillibacter sp.]MDD3346156.1 calcium/sodium antiporter [Oscillibacter sp.]